MNPRYLQFLCLLASANLLAQDATKQAKLPDPDLQHDPSNWLREENSGVNGLLYERWNDVPGKSVTYGRMMPERKSKPAVRGQLSDFSTLPNDGKYYLSRMRGWVVAPKSGTYLLMLSADDNAELWISTTESQYDKKRIAWITGEGWFGYSNPEESRRINSQRATVQLKEGQKYYIETWHKESTGNDHLSVRWWFEKDRHSKLITQDNLLAWKTDETDQDDNGLPDEWQKKSLLPAESDGWDDADNDGVNNFDEYKAGSDPMSAAGVEGALLWETWFGFGGNQIIDFTTYGRTRFAADRAVFLKGSSIPVEYGSNCAYRLSGYVIPKVSGDYQLAVTGDDATELWLSSDDDPANMKRIAFSDRRRGNFNWTAVPSQQSMAIRLEADRSYFFQVLCKNGRNEGRAELGWRRPGDKKFVSIGTEYLKSPRLRENDRDRNRLDDQWVRNAVNSDLAKKAKLEWISEWGDPDKDGINNRLEYLYGSDPMKAQPIIGKLTRQWWFNIPGRSLAEDRVMRAKLSKPNMVTILEQGVRAERNTTDNFLSRTRGYITAPVTGVYRFWLSGDDTAELWLSSNQTKFRKQLISSVGRGKGNEFMTNGFTGVDSWDQYSQQQSRDILLEAGQIYFVEILHKDNDGDDHVSVAWSYRENDSQKPTVRQVVPAEVLSAFVIDSEDSDDDYLPDSWEKFYKLSVIDNGSRDYAKQGENGDFDTDGLTNYKEYLLGTNPALSDSDGDGVGDGVEVNLYGSNPIVKDASEPKHHSYINLTSYHDQASAWINTPENGIVSTKRRGPVDFSFTINEPGIYVLEVDALALSTTSYTSNIPFITSLNGIVIGKSQASKSAQKFRWITQRLDAGRHVVRIDNRNVRSGSNLSIRSIQLLRHEGEDRDSNHIPDWMENHLKRNNQITSVNFDSPTSPACVEGVSRLPNDVTLKVKDGEKVAIESGIANAWYSNIPLSAESDTQVTALFERGAITQTHVFRWVETNVLQSPNHMKVRVGDSLKLTAYIAGDKSKYSLFCNGQHLVPEEKTNIVAFTFAKPGVYEIIASASNDPSHADAILKVEAVTANFGKALSLASGSTRTWKLDRVPHDLFIQSDPILEIKERNVENQKSRVVDVTSYASMGASARVLARLYEDGPIVAGTTVETFYLANSSESNSNFIVNTLPDGTRVIRSIYVIDGHIPADLSIWLEMYVTDTVFGNGDSWLELTAADFNENGEATIEFHKAPGSNSPFICHWIRPYLDSNDYSENSK